MKATIRLTAETQEGEIMVYKWWDGKTHITIKDETPVNKEILLLCLDIIEDELRSKKGE